MTVEMMRAARFNGGRNIVVESRPAVSPGHGELVLQVEANALCGSERGQYLSGSRITPGHEIAGVVIDRGAGVQTPVGARGVVFLMDFCGCCRSCRSGHTNQCLARRADRGFSHDGGYAERVVVSESQFFEVDPALSGPEATLLLDIMGTGGHAISRARRVHDEMESVLVMGAGPIGLGVLAMAHLLLGVPIAIADYAPYRLKLAESLGGRPIDLGVQSLSEGLVHLGMDRVDAAMDTSGKQPAREGAVAALGSRGVLVCIGHGEGLSLDVSRDLIAPERAVLGSEYFRFDELPANLDLLRRERSYLKQIITHHLPLDEIETAFELFFSGKTGKVIVEP